ncbi:hypothetical protein TNCV_5092082 [Trichonephila clavipes]|nr:hypothetical protein TNCV_5092082 [Trichonephila clavipes]
MASLGPQSLPPTNLGHVDEEMVPPEICDGDLKAIMRLVHAVASHYKPDTVLNPPRPMQRYANGSQTKMCRVEVLQA